MLTIWCLATGRNKVDKAKTEVRIEVCWTGLEHAPSPSEEDGELKTRGAKQTVCLCRKKGVGLIKKLSKNNITLKSGVYEQSSLMHRLNCYVKVICTWIVELLFFCIACFTSTLPAYVWYSVEVYSCAINSCLFFLNVLLECIESLRDSSGSIK